MRFTSSILQTLTKTPSGFLLFGLVALIFVSCASPLERASRGRQKALRQIDAEACERNGGEIRDVCLTQMPACVTPYSDAGKTCSDSSDCLGLCLYEGEETEIGAQVVGICQQDDNPCGCFSEVVDGRLTQTLCAD